MIFTKCTTALSNTAQEILPCPLDQEIQEWTANSGPKERKYVPVFGTVYLTTS